jgi:hypothetical protein
MANMYRKISIHGLTDVLGRTRSGKNIAATALPSGDCKETHRDHPAALLDAAAYAHFAAAQDVYRRQELATGVSAYAIALADWFEAPRVLQIDVDAWSGEIGQTIRVKARDNVKVAAVTVVIRDAEGNVLESGEAVPSRTSSAWWTYTTGSHMEMSPFPHVQATARDLAGNQDSFTIC